jgi:hypothetical protein
MRNWLVGVRTAVACVATLGVAPTTPSDPIGVYALVDRVVMEPDTISPRRIQIWGAFAMQRHPDSYAVAKGYLYYELNQRNPRATFAEWFDLERMAGGGRIVGFGGRFHDNGRVRLEREQLTAPDVYPVASGVYAVGPENPRSQWLRDIYAVPNTPALLAPTDGATIRPGPVRLVARTLVDTTARYLFEIEEIGGLRETSDTLAAGRGETAWSPRMAVRAGKEYEWRVRAFAGGLSSAPAVVRFSVER